MSNSLLGVEVSLNKLHYVYVEKKYRGFFLSKKGVVSFNEAAPFSFAFPQALQEVLLKEKISPAKLFVSVFREDVVTQQIIIPRMPDEEAEEVIAGEIEKNHLFRSKEFEYVYHLIELDKNKIKAIFSAVFKEIVTTVISTAKNLKIRLEALELSPLNILPLVYLLNRDKDEALVVVDEKLTYVMISGKKECRVFYACSTGKADLYDPQARGINKYVFDGWVAEIKRIIKSYSFEYNGTEIKGIWLVWDDENLPNLDSVLRKEFTEEVRRVDLASVSGFKIAPQFQLNSRDIIACAPAVSFLKKLKSEFSFERLLRLEKLKKALSRQIYAFLTYIVVLSILLAGVFIYFKTETISLTAQLEDSRLRISVLEKQTKQLKEAKAQAEELKQRLLDQATFVRKLNRVSWSRVFAEMVSDLPDGLCFTSFKVAGTGSVQLKGDAFNIEKVADLMRRVDRSKVLKNAKFDFLREAMIEKVKLFSFGILAQLRENTSEQK